MADNQHEKQYTTEWSFSFEELGDRVGSFIKSLGADDAIQTERFSEPVGSATSASIRLDTPVGTTVVKKLGGDALIDAEITHIGEVKFAVVGDSEKQVTLSQRNDAADWMRGIFGWIGNMRRLRWEVGLTPSIPLSLDMHSGVGESTFDLRDLALTGVNIHGGTGEMDVWLPVTAERLRAEINGGIGEIDVTVPAGANLDLFIRAGTGEINLDIGEGAALYAKIKGGVGQTNVRVAPGAAVHVKANIGLGDLNIPSSYTRLREDDTFVGKSGTWQTLGFETAERQITIEYEGGVGELRVR